MSISARQAELFAGESWTVLYSAFASINFNATDPATINAALQNYIRTNYPESFNDWIVSSEFVALIDLLSWLAGTLAFKTDLAARENFIDTAEARESILRLARFLSYNPSRCQPATGILKITSVSTDSTVFDSYGTNLSNATISWNDTNNVNWQEQFNTILNDAFISTNPFGVPLTTGTVSNVATQLYRLTGLASKSSFGFTSTVSGTSMDFEVCNGDFADGGVLFERPPNPKNAFNFYYLNDGTGNTSNRTGFFLLFKQGTTQHQAYTITVPVQNQLLDINSTNINQNDVWVQTVSDTGDVTIDWIKVPAIIDNNITFNNIPLSQRSIFSVLTRDNDQITIRFSDGFFGNAPTGIIQTTYRVSNGLTYQINPLEISNITLQIAYVNPKGTPQTLILTVSLMESVANAATAETTEQIRQRAPQVYGTQNRMVSGEDYNSYPLSLNLAAKIKAVNRVYSGQSRYIVLNDPTGTYQDLSLFADDGILFADPRDTYFEVPISLNKSSDQIINDYLLPALAQYTTTNLISDVLMQNVINGTILSQPNVWHTADADLFQTTGWFATLDPLIQSGAIVQFAIAGVPTWVAVIDVQGVSDTIPALNTAGPVTLSQEVPTGAQVVAILPSANVAPNSTVVSAIAENFRLRLSFTLWYDYSNAGSLGGPVWQVNAPQNDFGAPPAALSDTQLLIVTVNYISGMWQLSSRGLAYVFESVNDIAWFDNGKRSLAQATGESVMDTVRVMRVNRDLNNPGGFALTTDYNLRIDRLWLYPDGTVEPRRSMVLLYDSHQDGYPDVPDTYYKLIASGVPHTVTLWTAVHTTILTLASTNGISIGQTVSGVGIAVGSIVTAVTPSTVTLSIPTTRVILNGATVTIGDTRSTYLFWSNTANPPYDQPIYTVRAYDTDTLRMADAPPIGTVGFQMTSTTSYLQDATFWICTETGWQQNTNGAYRFEFGRGPNVAASWVTANGVVVPTGDSLAFQWKHYAPSDHRIDPASTNIHDIFVLTYSYDAQVRQWITNGAVATDLPLPPTELELRLVFAPTEERKMFSDQIVWRPVKYKLLFGSSADSELQVQFKVVRVSNASISDGEIQSRIIDTINAYFAVGNFDFGETFYYTELAAYIHQQLVGMIGSVVIVPLAGDSAFGEGFEVTCLSDEIFISTAQITDIVLIQSNTAVNLRIRTK